MKKSYQDVSIGVAAGGAIGLIAPVTIGYTAAIAIPAWLMNIFESTSVMVGMSLWEMVVVQFVGVGALVLVLTVFACRNWVSKANLYVSGFVAAIASTFLFYYARYDSDIAFLAILKGSWWYFFVIGLALTAGTMLGAREKE